jgi:hypothetical protein
MFIRFTDFYCIAHDPNLSNTCCNLVNLLCANIETDNIKYLKDIRFEYYHPEDEYFNYMLYDKTNFNKFNINISYDELYTNSIVTFVEKAYNKFERNNITFFYDDNVIKTFGKDLYYNSIIKSIENLKNKHNIEIKFDIKHIINVIPGEVISTETGFCRVYDLISTRFKYNGISDKNICPGLIDKEDYGKSTQSNYPVKSYIINRKHEKYGKNIATYFTVVDFAATKTFYYTYSLINQEIKLYDYSSINLGFMDVIDWIYNKSNKTTDKYYEFKNTIGSICSLNEIDRYFSSYRIRIDREDFYTNSPIKEITKKIVEIKREIMDKHHLDKNVIYSFNIENIAEIHLKHVEIEQEKFNGQCHRIIENYDYLIKALNKTLVFAGTFTCENVVDKNTGSNHFDLRVKLSDVGYEYIYEIDKNIELF